MGDLFGSLSSLLPMAEAAIPFICPEAAPFLPILNSVMNSQKGAGGGGQDITDQILKNFLGLAGPGTSGLNFLSAQPFVSSSPIVRDHRTGAVGGKPAPVTVVAEGE